MTNTIDKRAPLKLEGLADGSTPKNPAAQALGRLGGSANTPAQRKQRRAAAQLAGRPRRVCTKCLQPVVGGHADRALDETCGAHGWRWERAGTRHPAPVSADRAALDKIAAILRAAPRTVVGGVQIFTPAAKAIADLVRATGRRLPR